MEGGVVSEWGVFFFFGACAVLVSEWGVFFFFGGVEAALSSTTSVFHSVLEVPPALCSKGHMHSHGGLVGSGAAGVLTLSEVGVFLLSLQKVVGHIFCKDVWRKHIFSVWTTGNFV